ncbi:MAG: hypothetical protein JO166_04105 [Deltaproteobacteria bacterium]|nr:hypothetical protein [Deltaproteobacteria bacterium]
MSKLSRQFEQVVTRTYRNVSGMRPFDLKGAIPKHQLIDSILVGYYKDGDLLYAGRVRAALTARGPW